MKKIFYLLFFSFAFFNCKENDNKNYREKQLAKEWKKHLRPENEKVNVIKESKTFALESSEVQGIDHERWKEFDYWKEMDNSFFERIEEKVFSNPDEAGGTATTLEIFKAIKKGETEIRFYKRHYYSPRKPENDTLTVKDTAAYLYSTYKFRIE
jgi:hypothetical protein